MPTLILPVPSPKQKTMITDKHKYLGFGGARGGGKSYGVDINCCIKGFQYDGITQTIVRKTYPELMENHIKKLKKMLQTHTHEFASYNDQRKEINLVNGSTIIFKYCDTLKDLERFQGLQTDILYLDEATQHPVEVWDQLKAIVRGDNPFPKQLICTCNPGGPGMSWFKRLFIERRFEANENPDDYAFIQSLVTDNLALMAAQPDYVQQLESLPPKLRKAWLEGDWNILEGMFFEDFRLEPDVMEANRHGVMLDADELRSEHRWCHVIEPFDLNEGEKRNWTCFRSYDFGYGKPWSLAWNFVDYDGVIYRAMEFYGCTGTPNEGMRWTPDMQFAEVQRIEREHPWLKDRRIIGSVADPAIWDASRGESINDTAARYGIFFDPGDNNRIAGWMQCHYRLQFDDNGYSRFYVFNNCKDFIRTIPLMMYNDHRPEDLDTTLEDHAADDWRYGMMAYPIKPVRQVVEKKIISDPLDMFTDKTNRRNLMW